MANVRHLLYYVYPVAGNGNWQRNVDALKKRIDQFTGSRTVVISYEEGSVRPIPGGPHWHRPPWTLDEPDAVRERLAGTECDTFVVRNRAEVGEGMAFLKLWRAAERHTGPADVTMYGHAKGVMWPLDPAVAVHPWTSVLYSVNLDYPTLVDESLETHPITGAFKQVWLRGRFQAVSQFHYSGTFFWFRNAAVFKRNWSRINPAWGGLEEWPGVIFPVAAGGCLFADTMVGPLYDPKILATHLEDFRQFYDRNVAVARPGAEREPWLSYCGYGC